MKTQVGGWARTVLGAGERRERGVRTNGERSGRRDWVLSFCAGKGQAHAFFTEFHVLFATKFKHGQTGDRRCQGRKTPLGNREKSEGRRGGQHMVEGTAHFVTVWKWEDRKDLETRHTFQMIFPQPGPNSCFLPSLNNAIKL